MAVICNFLLTPKRWGKGARDVSFRFHGSGRLFGSISIGIIRKVERDGKLLVVFVPVGDQPSRIPIEGFVGDLKGDRFVGFGGKQNILVPLVPGQVDALFKGRHEPMPRTEILLDVLVDQFEGQTPLVGLGIAALEDLVGRAADLDGLSGWLVAVVARWRSFQVGAVLAIVELLLPLGLEFFHVGSFREAPLVFFSLRVGKIISLVGMQCQTEFALVRPEVIAHQIWILGKVDRFQCQLLETFLPLAFGVLRRGDATTPEFRSDPVLAIDSSQQPDASR